MLETTISNRFKPQGFILALSMFLMGGIGLAYEYTFSKLASDLLGNSARQWAIIIGIMMFFMGIGADIQKYLNDKNLVEKLILSEICLGIVGGFGPFLLLWSFGHWLDHYILLQYGFISIIGLLIGFEIPLVTRINEEYSEDLRFNLARILKMDYIGALAGALVWIFVLPLWFSLMESAVVLGLINMAVALTTLYTFQGKIKNKLRLLLIIIFVSVALFYGLTQAKLFTVKAEQALYQDPILFSKTSKFQHIVVTKNKFGSLRCYINGHLQFNSEDEFIYHENLVHPAMSISPNKEKILILGGGDGLALREVLKYKEVKQVTLVDLDPLMTSLANEQPDLKALNKNSLGNAKLKIITPNGISSDETTQLYVQNRKIGRMREMEYSADINIINIDAAIFVQTVNEKYDVIIIDFPDPNTLELSKLYSKLFYKNVKERLSASGIMVQQATSPIHAKQAFLCIGRTMQDAGFATLPIHDNVPSFGEWGWWISGHDNMYTSDGIKQSLWNLDKLKVQTTYLTTELIKSITVFGKSQLITNETEITTPGNSAVYKYYLKGWQNNL